MTRCTSRTARAILVVIAILFAYAQQADAAAPPCTGSSVGTTCTATTQTQLTAVIDAIDAGSTTTPLPAVTTIELGANIALTSDLPLLDGPAVIDGEGYILNGGGTYRGLLLYDDTAAAVDITVQDLTFQDTVARGGAGGPGAGGGAGLGGAIFAGSGVDLTTSNLTLTGDGAVGGAGAASGFPEGGGGGVGGNGGAEFGGGGLGSGANGAGESPGSGQTGIAYTLASGGGPGDGSAVSGGLYGGGGAAGEDFGGGGGIGGAPGDESADTGGNGGFGGGGGGGGTAGGNGGFGGGGGSGSAGENEGGGNLGGNGGFGAGGGSASVGGNGGDAGGGGSGNSGSGSQGTSGPGAPPATANTSTPGGGGGAGLGGAIFLASGATLTVSGTLSEGNDVVSAGAGADGGAAGGAYGSAIFGQDPGGTLTFDPAAGQTETVAGTIVDELGGYGDSAPGAGWQLVKQGAGTLVLSGDNAYETTTGSGTSTQVTAGTLQITDFVKGNVTVTGGVLTVTGTVGGNVTVDAGGTLCDQSGHVDGSVINDGGAINQGTACASPPTATIASPATGGTYTLNQSVPTQFSCAEGAGGTGIASCSDSNGAGGVAGTIAGSLNTATTGAHTYTVTATSKDGLTATASIAYTVSAVCDQNVTFQLTQVTTSGSVCLNQQANGSYQTIGPLTINGIPLPAVSSSTPYVITPPSSAHPGGLFGLLGGALAPKLTFNLGGSTGFALDAGVISWNLPAAPSSGNQLGTVATLSAPSGQSIKGLQIGGSIVVSFGRNGSDYYSSFAVTVDLPSIFKAGPSSSSGGITGTVAIRADASGVNFDGLIIQVSGAYIGSLQVKSACFSYSPSGASGAVSSCPEPALTGSPLQALDCTAGGGDSWAGSADVVLPVGGSPELSFYGGFADGTIDSLSVDAAGLKVPVAEDVFLTNVGLQLCLPTATQGFGIEGDVGVGVLPTGDNYLASINAAFRYEAAFGSTPWSLELGGSLAVEGTQIGTATLAFGGTPIITFDIKVGVTFSIVSINGEVQGFFETASPYEFSVEGDAQACLQDIGCLTGNAAVSSLGISACVGVAQFHYWVLVQDSDWEWYAWWRVHWVEETTTWQAGFGYYWGGALSVWGDSCDVEAYEIPTPTNAAMAAAAVSGTGTFVVPAHSPGTAVRITGIGGAPRVRVTGPGGVVIDPPAVGRVGERVGKLALVEQDASEHATAVLLLNPRPGRWHVTAVHGSVPIAGIRIAPGLDPPVITGGISRDIKGRVRGGIAYAAPRGEKIILYVSGPHHSEQVLGVAHGTPCPQNAGVAGGPSGRLCQRISFSPAYGPSGRRTVYAVVSRNGLVLERVTIGTVQVSFPKAVLGKLVALRGTGAIEIMWATLSGARDYAVAVDTSDGRRLSFTTRSGRLRVSGIAGTVAVKVTVWPVMTDGVIGRSASAKLTVGKPKPKPKKKKKKKKK